MFDVLKMARPVFSRLHFDIIKYFSQKPFIFKNVIFAFLTKKRGRKRKLFQNTIKLLSMKMHKFRQKFISISSAHSQKNEIKNVRLLLCLSVYIGDFKISAKIFSIALISAK